MTAPLPARLRGAIVRAVGRMGYELSRTAPPTEARRLRQAVLARLEIGLILDVGANDGAFARDVRTDGFARRIISFEPTDEAFDRLNSDSVRDPLWECRRVALGNDDRETEIRIAANSSSSSLLAMNPLHVLSAPESAYVGTQAVRLARLDSLRDDLRLTGERAFLKVDVQGYELEVLQGAVESLADVLAVECELSLAPLYEGQALFADLVEWLRAPGFVLVGLESVHFDARSGELLQVNGLFTRPGA